MSFHSKLLSHRYPELCHLPGPKPTFPLGNLVDAMRQRPWELSLDYADRYGPYTVLWLFDQPAVFVHDPHAIDEILNTKKEYFFKDEPIGAMTPLSSDSNLFVVNGADWSRKKKASFFSDGRYRDWLYDSFAPSQTYLASKIAHAIPIEDRLPFEDFLYRLVFDFQSQLSFGREMGREDVDRYNHLIDNIDLRMKTNLPVLSPQFHSTKRKWLKAIDDLVRENALDSNGRSISHLLTRHSLFPRDELIQELSNIYPGGVYSITAALGHALGYLCAETRHWHALREELIELRKNECLTYVELTQCAALERVVRETLRLFAPAPVFMRMVKADEVQVGAIRLRKGVRTLIGIMPLQRNRTHWPEPEAFKPDRWTPEVMQANPYGSDYFFPFGRGPRSCAGSSLALFMIRSVLFSLLSDSMLEVSVTKPKSHTFYFGCMMPKEMTATIRRKAQLRHVPVPEAIVVPFGHERLDLYQLALDFIVVANDVIEQLPQGQNHLADQLRRAASSIVLNIAEGAGLKQDKRRSYLCAIGSATECAAIFDILLRLRAVPADRHEEAKKQLERIASMLIKHVDSTRDRIHS